MEGAIAFEILGGLEIRLEIRLDIRAMNVFKLSYMLGY